MISELPEKFFQQLLSHKPESLGLFISPLPSDYITITDLVLLLPLRVRKLLRQVAVFRGLNISQNCAYTLKATLSTL